MSTIVSENRRIAKNTILLYFRMILLLCVSLYTSRVILDALGFVDYGIYNVVGGVVAMFSFVNMALANSTSRFITYALGKDDVNYSRKVFNASFKVHLLIAIVVFIIAETVGLWFLHNKLVIPDNRLQTAVWVYHLSVISSLISILYAPFNAVIIAHEKMGAFAFMSILEGLLKLSFALYISVTDFDRLLLYAILLLCASVINVFVYLIYCIRNFTEVIFTRRGDTSIIKEISSFAGWSMIGNLAYIGYTQGLNILLNLFFGPQVNAARGISNQLQGAVMGFVTNFQMAINPQITKSFAKQDFSRLHTLVFSSSKFSFFLLYCIILPISIEVKNILNIWLIDVPKYAVEFTILTLYARLIDTLSNPLSIANNATGSIRRYQIFEGGTLLLIVPISYLVLRQGGSPVSVFWIQLVIMYIAQIVRLFLVCYKIKMSINSYIKNVVLKILPVAFISPILPIFLYRYLNNSFLSVFLVIISSIISVIIFSFVIGLNKNEKQRVIIRVSCFLKSII